MITKTRLIEALEKKDFARVKELLDEGETMPEDISKFDHLYKSIVKGKGFTVLDTLVEKGTINTDIYEYNSFKYSIYELLFKNLPIDEESLSYLRSFIERSDNNNEEVEGHTLLSYAISLWADPAIIQTLINAGLRTDFRNKNDENLVSQVVKIKMIPEEKQLAYLDLLIKAGVDVNESNVAKQYSLHLAVEKNSNHLLDILLVNGARPNEQDSKGNTAFHYALPGGQDVYDKLAAIELPDFNLQNSEGQTVLSEYISSIGNNAKTADLLERLIDDGGDLEQTTRHYDEQRSGWDWIIEKDADLLKRILDKTGRDVNKQDDKGNTLLHKICSINSYRSEEIAKTIYKKAKILIDLGADSTITNTNDETAIQIALIDSFKARTVDLLLKAKTNQ